VAPREIPGGPHASKTQIVLSITEERRPGKRSPQPGAATEAAKVGSLSIRLGLGWAKSHSFTTGQCPVMKYHRGHQVRARPQRVPRHPL